MTERLERAPLLWLVAVGFLMQTLDATIVNTALPAMAASLHESPVAMQSVVIAYTLAMAMLIPVSGWLSDRFGTRKTYIGAIAVFGGSSLLCALAPSLPVLVAARLLQGCGGAMLLPVGRLAVLRAFPPPRFLSAMSFVTVPGLIGPLIGPLLGGWLVEVATWHWIFWINVPVAIIGALAARRHMPDTRGAHPTGFDLRGYLYLAFGMAALTLSLQGAAELRLPVLAGATLAAAGIGCFVAYWRHARRDGAPLFAPEVFAVKSFRLGLAGNLGTRLGSGGMPFLVPLTLQVALGFSPVRSGLMMMPVAIAAMFTKRFAAFLITRHGFKRVLVANTVLVGLSIAGFALFLRGAPALMQVLQLLAFGAFNSLQFSAMNSLVLKDLSPRQASEGNALLSMTQMLAMGLGVATGGALLSVFGRALGGDAPALPHAAFQATFLVLGLLTAASAATYARLDDQ